MSASLLERAQEWNAAHPGEAVSVFACRFPGQFREAANALRQARKEAPLESLPPDAPATDAH